MGQCDYFSKSKTLTVFQPLTGKKIIFFYDQCDFTITILQMADYNCSEYLHVWWHIMAASTG